MNYKNEAKSVMCSLWEGKEDTTERDLKDEHTKEECLDITKVYRKNKRKRETESEILEENEKRTEIELVVEQQKENEKRQ